MQITIDGRLYFESGLGRYLQRHVPYIADYYASKGHTVILLGEKEKLSFLGVKVIEFNAPIYSIKEQLLFPKVIPACDLFFSPHYNVPLLPIKARHRITTIHDVFHLAFYDTLSFSQKVYAKYVIKQALQKSDKVITISAFSKSEILKHTHQKYASKIELIYNGVELLQKNSSTIDNHYSNYFFFVGNIKPHKNLRRTILAYEQFLKQYTGRDIPKFVIAGKKEGFITGDDNVVAYVENNSVLKQQVVFTGYVSDDELTALYKNALAFVFPSYYEGFGSPPLEAMMYNTPVIASNAASIPEVCGDAALYFDPYDVNAISETMLQIVNDIPTRNMLIEKGAEQVIDFAVEKSVEKHIALFDKILNLS